MVYYCYNCESEVPHAMEQENKELLCSRCLEPFVEILDEEMEVESPSPESVANSFNNSRQQAPPPPLPPVGQLFAPMFAAQPSFALPPQQRPVNTSFHVQVQQLGAGGISSVQFSSSQSGAGGFPPSASLIRPQTGSLPMPLNGFIPLLDISDGPSSFLNQLFGDMGEFLSERDFHDFLNRMHQQHEDQGKPPASEEAIQQLNTKIMTKEDEAKMADQQCAVCQDKFLESEEVTCLPCDHTYHKNCVVPWLTRHCTCPVCRSEVKVQPSETCPVACTPETSV